MSSLDPIKPFSSNLHGSYSWPQSLQGIHFGPGSIKTALPKLLAKIGAKKALVVTGRSLHEKTDVVRRVENVLKELNAYGATFYEIGQHSPIAGIENGLQQFKDVGADVIVAVGGGSPVDASKAILYFQQQETGGPYLKQIAIPTTLSAAEYTVGAGYTNEEGVKVAVNAPELVPAGIILDAELTLATPERLWLSTGIRALDHAVENLYRPLVAPPLKHLCYAALVDLFKYLPLSKANPQAVDVRQKLQLASWMSIWPLQLERYGALGLSHSLGHKIGARYSIPHGITSCLTLAPTVALQTELASGEDKEWLSGALFHLRQPSTGSIDGDIRKLSAEIYSLVEGLGLRSTLTEYNVPRADLPEIAQLALGSKEDPAQPKVVALLEALY
ncbi:iron-containing alcohol dehydrogenase [Trametes versicolor FP-101664 SS1]|uniref:iron-containing alcohol dehydrogenase n=1 Tax=Trametes versicolor (strain FP-101664) TaxID=717944 RepID=UPI000462208D|nr:iron-containing alcohol dehydrogenase [Trametes versicolor FP-101664 SS1]EIW63198.1 iron-containing alcohol dehydrogenase [Trametes versicolor FP-101664 SS1]